MSEWLAQIGWVDISIAVVIFLSILVGLFRGFVREAISLLVWIVAIFLSFLYSEALSKHLADHIHAPEMRFVVSFALIFIAVLIGGMIIGAVIRLLMDKTGFSPWDRCLGLIFGLARGVLLIAMVLLFVRMSSMAEAPWMKESYLVERMMPLVSWLQDQLPKELPVMSEWLHKDISFVEPVAEV